MHSSPSLIQPAQPTTAQPSQPSGNMLQHAPEHHITGLKQRSTLENVTSQGLNRATRSTMSRDRASKARRGSSSLDPPPPLLRGHNRFCGSWTLLACHATADISAATFHSSHRWFRGWEGGAAGGFSEPRNTRSSLLSGPGMALSGHGFPKHASSEREVLIGLPSL